jgi:DNA relaxase NicK
MQSALIAAAVAILGWYVTYAYAKRRDDQTRRTEIRLKHRQRQIEELYGPLLSLIEQIFNICQVRQHILKAEKRGVSRLNKKRRFASSFRESTFRRFTTKSGPF